MEMAGGAEIAGREAGRGHQQREQALPVVRRRFGKPRHPEPGGGEVHLGRGLGPAVPGGDPRAAGDEVNLRGWAQRELSIARTY